MNSVVIFVHIPKCGGMTFNEVLRSIYGPRLFYHAEIGDKLAITMAADLREFEAVTSHARYGLHERFGRPGVYLSIIREPLENFVSFYNDVTNKPGHFLQGDGNRAILCVPRCQRPSGAAQPTVPPHLQQRGLSACPRIRRNAVRSGSSARMLR